MRGTSAPAAERSSVLVLVATTPLYRGATMAMLLSGLGMSAAAPQIASFLVRELGASLPTAGLFYLTNLTAPLAGYLVGSRSDRSGYRLGLFRTCALLGGLGWAGIAFSRQVWTPFVISAVVLGFAGAAGSQLFAALRDETVRRNDPNGDTVVAVVRMALTAGWVIGPVLGTFLAAQAGYRVLLLATALCTLGQVIPLGFLRTPILDRAAAGAPAHRIGVRRLVPLLAFTGLYVLVYAGESVKYAYLPIYMRYQLRLEPVVSGAVIGIQPLVELVLMPLSVLLARRFGTMRVMVVGAGCGVAANLCFAGIASAGGMFAGQVLMGFVWGIFAALGILAAQRLLPEAVATASAIFLTSTAISSALGGLTGSIGIATLGLPHVFVAPASYALLAAAGLAIMARAERQPSASSSGAAAKS
ncbi:MFS transporter [Kribbella sp.]|uniref:MFS transporter n=1 Tax=Kribbella sp. TaxID=1871183 RepID=UPI002D23969A|nr:MFS transporter [Kribbella sp.]HZX05067.1 MFS transporter [Kribbella sp.]